MTLQPPPPGRQTLQLITVTLVPAVGTLGKFTERVKTHKTLNLVAGGDTNKKLLNFHRII
jgi:hypothetical protein